MSDMSAELANRFNRQRNGATQYKQYTGYNSNQGYSNGYSSRSPQNKGSRQQSNPIYSQFKEITENQPSVAEELLQAFNGKNIFLFKYHGMIVAKTPYSAEATTRFKALHGLFYAGAKCWFFALDKKDELVAALRELYPEHSNTNNTASTKTANNRPTLIPAQSTGVATNQIAPASSNGYLVIDYTKLRNVKSYFEKTKQQIVKQDNCLFINQDLTGTFSQKAKLFNAVYIADCNMWVCSAQFEKMI